MISTGWFVFGLVCLLLGLPATLGFALGNKKSVGCFPFLTFVLGATLTILYFVKG